MQPSNYFETIIFFIQTIYKSEKCTRCPFIVPNASSSLRIRIIADYELQNYQVELAIIL